MRAHKQVFQETGKKRENTRKHYRSKKSFSCEIYAGTSKAAHKIFQQRGASSIREFPFFITCSSKHEVMAEDWVCLQLGMRLQLGVLRYYDNDSDDNSIMKCLLLVVLLCVKFIDSVGK